MTKSTRASSSSSPPMTGSASPPSASSRANLPLAKTRRADVVQWESCFRPQDIPIPEGFEEIDSVVEEYERDPAKAKALKAARQRLADKLPTATTLAKLRLSRGWSQKRLADEIGTS